MNSELELHKSDLISEGYEFQDESYNYMGKDFFQWAFQKNGHRIILKEKRNSVVIQHWYYCVDMWTLSFERELIKGVP